MQISIGNNVIFYRKILIKFNFIVEINVKTFHLKNYYYGIYPQLGSWQDEPNCNECDKDYKCTTCEEGIADKKVKQMHYDLFLELIDIYAFYKTREDYSKYNELKNKINNLIKN